MPVPSAPRGSAPTAAERIAPVRKRRWYTVSSTFCLVLALGSFSAASRASAEALASTDQAVSLGTLATQGRFDEVLDVLQIDAERAPEAGIASLIHDLERYHANEGLRQKQRQATYEQALATVRDKVAANDLEAAIIAAIEAHSLADEPLLVLRDPAVSDLVTRTEIAAKQAELNEDWVEAGVLFARLNLLFEDDARYRLDVKRVNTHLRVLALYTPEALRSLQRARAQRVGRADDFNAAAADDETWQTRLKGITPDMLRESLKTAAEQHIDHRGYAALMAGSLEPLLTLLATPALADAFPSLADEQATRAFRKELLRLKAEFKDPQRPLTQFRALARMDEVLAHNQRTVRLPEAVLAYEMAEGALSTLDEFSSMYWPEDVSYLARSTQGSFTGIGVQIARRTDDKTSVEAAAGGEAAVTAAGGHIAIVSPLSGSPAMAVGIEAGDIIRTVDGKDASNWSLTKAVREITGPPNTDVVLGIERKGHDELIEFRVTRGVIPIESVKGWSHDEQGNWDYWLDREAGVGYIRLTQFIPQSVDDIDRAVNQLEAEGHLHGLILDLRHNPGGLLTSAIQVTNRFLKDGPILFTVDGQRNIKSAWNARSRGTYDDFEVVVLINQGSASASEIVSGALQDRGRAFIIGDRSYGKGSVQDVYWFPNARNPTYGLKVTTQYYQLPGGRIIHRTPEAKEWGVQPDLAVDVTNQTVAWNLELRQEIDVLRDGENQTLDVARSKPWVRLAGLEPVDVKADNADETVVVPLPQPEDLLELGLDPQLEAALLLLKTRQIAGDTAVATTE